MQPEAEQEGRRLLEHVAWSRVVGGEEGWVQVQVQVQVQPYSPIALKSYSPNPTGVSPMVRPITQAACRMYMHHTCGHAHARAHA